MIEYKQGSTAFVPVRIIDATTGLGVAGVAFGSVTATVLKSDSTTENANPASGAAWVEVTTGAFAGTGTYLLQLSAARLNTAGLLTYAVAVAAANTYVGAVKVVANEEVDTYTRLGAPIGASISADIADTNADLAAVATNVTLLKKYEEGRWKIHITGPDANRLVIYDTDDTTPLFKFDLKDSGGSATFVNPFERVPFP